MSHIQTESKEKNLWPSDARHALAVLAAAMIAGEIRNKRAALIAFARANVPHLEKVSDNAAYNAAHKAMQNLNACRMDAGLPDVPGYAGSFTNATNYDIAFVDAIAVAEGMPVDALMARVNNGRVNGIDKKYWRVVKGRRVVIESKPRPPFDLAYLTAKLNAI